MGGGEGEGCSGYGGLPSCSPVRQSLSKMGSILEGKYLFLDENYFSL